MRSLVKVLNSLHNWFQIISCLLILILCVLNLGRIDDHKETLIFILRVIQLEQSLDIVFNLLTRGGGILSSVMQISGRNFVALFIIDMFTDSFSLSIVIICWNLGDVIRYLFYTIKNKTLTYVRYNAFKILYPLGILGECLTVEHKLQRKDTVHPGLFRLLQVILVLGMLYLYKYLLKKSKEVFKKENQEKALNKNE